jgi:hypothetical protein
VTDNEKHLDIREKLQSLPSVKASDDFIMKLQKRINLAEAQPSTQIHKQHQHKLEEGFFARLFGGRNSWIVPAVGVTAVVFLVFIWVFVVNQNNITTSNDSNDQTLTQSEEQNPSENENLSSNEEENNIGETLKTKLPGTEITSNFGYTDSRSELDRGDLEGGITDEVVSEKPEVKISQPTTTDDVTTESPSPSMEVRGLKEKEEDKSSMKTGVLKEKKASPPPAEKKKGDTPGKDMEDKIESTDEGKRVTRNLIDKTDLENLQEKVEEGVK